MTDEQDIFTEELRILRAAKAGIAGGGQPDRKQYEQLVGHYEKLLKTTAKLSRISDIQGRTLKEREQEIKTAHGDLQNLELLRRQLISDISHELRTPITSVQGYVKAFLDEVIPPDRTFLTMIYQKLLTINQLISDLFQLSTLKANQLPFHFQCIPMLQWFLSLQGKHALEAKRRGIDLAIDREVSTENRTALPPDTILLHIDPIRIEQVVTNFLDNALKYTAPGGSVRISGMLTANPPAANAMFAPPADNMPLCWFTLAVEDTGEGIDGNDLPFIFERFFRSRHAKVDPESGVGLGLAISKEIISQHEGGIGADSEPGRGSRFHFSLPAYDERTFPFESPADPKTSVHVEDAK